MTENDWLLLSEWIDGTLGTEARAALEARFNAEPELAHAARRLQVLESVAQSAGPTEADRTAAQAAPSIARWPIVVVVALLVAVVLLGRAPSSSLWRSTFVPDRFAQGASAPDGALGHEPAHSDASDDPQALGQRELMEPAQTASHGMGEPIPGAPEMQAGDAAVAVTMSMFFFLSPGVADAGPNDGGKPPDAGEPLDAGAADGGVLRRIVRLRRGDEFQIRSPEGVDFPDGVLHATRIARQVTFRAVSPGTQVIEASEVMDEPEMEITVEDEISPERTLVLVEGARQRLLAPGMARWSLPDRRVAAVAETAPFLDVVGASEGQTTLEVWFADGQRRAWPIVVTRKRELLNVDVRRSTQLSVAPGTWAKVTPAQLADAEVLGSRLIVRGRNVGAGVLEATDPAGRTTAWDLVVGGAGLRDNATATRTMRQDELPRVLRMRRGETIAIEVEPSWALISGNRVALWKKGNLLFVSSAKATEGMLMFHPRSGRVVVVIVVVDP